MHLSRNDRGKARDQFLRARAAAPDRRDAVIALARVRALDGDHAAAADLYRLALQSRPDDAERRLELGKCLLEMGRRDEGEAVLRIALRGDARWIGPAIKALAATPHGRFFLRPSAAARFLGVEAR
jgi:Tfp pilus assembly protein PilF